MPPRWKPGQSGNADGRAKDHALTRSLRMALNDYVEVRDDPQEKAKKIKRIDQLTRALLDQAATGNVPALQMVFERLEGKVPNVNVEIPVKPAEEMTHDELVAFIAGTIADRGTEEDSTLARAKPAGNA